VGVGGLTRAVGLVVGGIVSAGYDMHPEGCITEGLAGTRKACSL
jgi:hypothetical protein